MSWTAHGEMGRKQPIRITDHNGGHGVADGGRKMVAGHHRMEGPSEHEVYFRREEEATMGPDDGLGQLLDRFEPLILDRYPGPRYGFAGSILGNLAHVQYPPIRWFVTREHARSCGVIGSGKRPGNKGRVTNANNHDSHAAHNGVFISGG
jgi:hypothetical protein